MQEFDLQAVSVSAATATIMEKHAVRVIKDPAVKEVDEPTFAKINGLILGRKGIFPT